MKTHRSPDLICVTGSLVPSAATDPLGTGWGSYHGTAWLRRGFDRLQGLASKVCLGDLLPQSGAQPLLLLVVLLQEKHWLTAAPVSWYGSKGNCFTAGRSHHPMTCKTKPSFLEGVLHVIVVTVALVTQRTCLAATEESPTLTAALCAPGAKRNVRMKCWGIAGSEVEDYKAVKTFWCSKAIKTY